MRETFIALDVETANQSRASICQIGLVAYEGANCRWKWTSLVNPEEDFDRICVDTHGLGSLDVRDAPTFPDILSVISESIGDQIVASHSPFDCQSMNHAAAKYGLELPACRWIDTCEISRLAWPDLPNHKLDTLCEHFTIELDHHNALSDATACAEVLARAVLDTGMLVHQLMARVGTIPAPPPADRSGGKSRYPERISLSAQTTGPLSGQVLVCTGEFGMSRVNLAQLATGLGCDVDDKFTKKRTTILVVGERDATKFGGEKKSAKQRAAEAAVADGKKVTILSEAEFLALIKQYQA